MLKDLTLYWKNDLIAAFNVALVALPLGLGIASAGGIPPIAGVFSAIAGAFVCSFIRGSHVAINGPGNGMIAVTISAVLLLKPHGPDFFNYMLGAFVVSGVVIFLFGLLKLGKFGDNFPSTVVLGLLAGIGIIIMIKQIKPGFGITGAHYLDFSTAHLPESIVFLVSLSILIAYEFSKHRLIRFVPGPVWVLLFAIPFVLYFGIKTNEHIVFNSTVYPTTDHFFVNVPNIFSGIGSFSTLINRFPFPDFSLINTLDFWLVVINVTLVGTLESLLSAKAVEKLDPLGRKVNLNKDLLALGLGTVASGFIGGMPVNTVIARSSININSGGRTSWSNFWAGVLLLLALVFGSDYLNYIPFAALAALLLVTGFKLTKPKVYKDAWLHGKEQIAILILTLIVTKFFGIINGLLVGMLFNLVLHIILFDGSVVLFFRILFKPNLKTVDSKDSRVFVRLYGILNFLNIQPLETLLKNIPLGKRLTIDFSHLKLVDRTVLEFIQNFALDYRKEEGGTFESVGLDAHFTTSTYPRSLHYLKKDKKKLTSVVRKTIRQERLTVLAQENDWIFETPMVWETPELNRFFYFKQHPIEYSSNVIYGRYKDLGITWEISDMTYDDGIFIETRERHTTEHLVRLPVVLPDFILDREFLFDRLKDMVEHTDIDFPDYPEFSKKFALQSNDEQAVRKVFGHDVIAFFKEHDVYHIECVESKLVIFRERRLASVDEIKDMISYTHALCTSLLKYATI